MERLSELLSAIKPFVLGWISAAGGGSGPFAPSPHDLNSAHHSGSIADSQAPQFLLSNGGRTLTGNLAVSSGITIDGVDISAFNGEAFVTLGNTAGLPNERALTNGSGITITDGGAGSDVTVAVDATVARNTWPVNAGAGLTGGGNLAAGGITLTVGAGAGITVNADDVALTTPGSLSATSTNSATGNHTHAIDSTMARSAITVTGTGALGGGGDLTANRTITMNTPGSLSATSTNSATTNHTHAIDSTMARSAITVTGTGALGGGGDLTANRTITMNTPGGLSVSSTNSATTNHTHAIASSSNPGSAASLLASDANGALQLTSLTLSTALTTPRMTAAANLTIDPTGDVIFDPAGNDILPNANYDLNIGAPNKKYLTLHAAELWVETLVAQDMIATIGGRIIVAPTTTLIADLTTGGTTIDVKHNQMRIGDRALMQADGKIEWIEIKSEPTTISGGYRYNVTRNLDGTGANQWYAGDAMVNTGQAGNGFIDLYSLSAVLSPGVDYIFNYNQTGAAFSVNYAVYSNFTLFGDGANTEVNDAVYFGVTGTTWSNLYYNLGTAAVYTATLTWEYWNGSAWATFSPTTTDFKTTGLLATTWVAGNLTGWAANTVNSISAYWVRVRISEFTTWTTQPVQAGARIYRDRRQYGPTVAGQVWNSSTFGDVSEHWAIGNLNGLYGYTANVFGVAVGKYSASTSWLSADATNGIRIMRGSTQLAQWDINGNILIGQAAAGQDNIYISSGAISIRNNTTERIGLTADGILTIKDSVGNAVFTFNTAAGAEFTLPLALGSNGGIYQGSGTFAAPSTGLKIWNDSGVGRIAGYNGGALQWYANTDGKLYAGGGNVVIDNNGVTILAQTVYNRASALVIYNGSGARITSEIYSTISSPLDEMFIKSTSGSGTGWGSRINILAQGGGTATGYGEIRLYAAASTAPAKGVNIYSTNGNVVTTTVNSDNFNVNCGLNLGTATGATTGQLFASSLIKSTLSDSPQLQLNRDNNLYLTAEVTAYNFKLELTGTANQAFLFKATKTMTAGLTDGFSATLNTAPTYSGAYTVTRHNYIQVQNPSLLNSAALTDACVFRFDAAAGTHKAVDSGSTKTSPGTVNAWVKINVNGTVYYIPAYTSKT